MIRLLFAALALACLCQTVEARPKAQTYAPECYVWLDCGFAHSGARGVTESAPRVSRQERREARRIARGEAIAKAVGFGAVVERPPSRPKTVRGLNLVHGLNDTKLDSGPGPAIGLVSAIAKPARYIAGRLICAINVGSALAERGIKGTGSALALSYLKWGHASGPVPGAVAVSGRRGGGHVAIVSRVVNGQVYVWNPSPRGRGWQEQIYRHRAISYRVASQ